MKPYTKIVSVLVLMLGAALITTPADATTPRSGGVDWALSADVHDDGSEAAVVATDDRRRICASVLLDWTDLNVLRNDVGRRLQVTSFGQPSNGESRWNDGRLEYRDVNGNGSYWTYYRIQDRRGHEDLGFWRVTADRSC